MLVKKQNGFTLVESLITILVMSILFLGVYKLIDFSIKITGDNKHRMAATVIANQKMELIRNLPYSDVGTVSGMVNGVIQNNEPAHAYNIVITRNKKGALKMTEIEPQTDMKRDFPNDSVYLIIM